MERLYTHEFIMEKDQCIGCTCKMSLILRIEKFWQTSMQKHDYMQFLSENLWIWEMTSSVGLYYHYSELFDSNIVCSLEQEM